MLADGGVRASAALERRISGTLLGAATDRRLRNDLLRGRLTEELPPPGLDALIAGGNLRLVPKPEPMAASGKTPRVLEERPTRKDRNRSAAAERPAEPAPAAPDDTVREARHALRVAKREARERSSRATTLERTAASRQRAAEVAERSAQQLRERLTRVEEQAAGKRRDATEAAAEATRARDAAGAAARAREEAERAVAATEAGAGTGGHHRQNHRRRKPRSVARGQ